MWIAALSLGLSGIGTAAESRRTISDSASSHEHSAWAGFVETNFPFFSSVLDARRLGAGWPADNLTPRGVILNLGEGCWACFDTDLLRISAIWAGQGVSPVSMAQGSYHQAGVKVPEGQEKLPRLGTPWLANGIYPGWQAGDSISLRDPREPGPDKSEVGRGPLAGTDGRFRAIRLIRGDVCLDYEVAGLAVRERIEARRVRGAPVVRRWFHIEEGAKPLWLLLGRRPDVGIEKLNVLVSSDQKDGQAVAELRSVTEGLHAVRVRRSTSPVEFSVMMGVGEVLTNWTGFGESDALPEPRWSETVTTRAALATASNAYVVDNIALPLDNPWKRNVRLADIAFLPDGRAAAVTFDGDVWTLSGLTGELREVTWKRFTSGLHEPLGISVRSGSCLSSIETASGVCATPTATKKRIDTNCSATPSLRRRRRASTPMESGGAGRVVRHRQRRSTGHDHRQAERHRVAHFGGRQKRQGDRLGIAPALHRGASGEWPVTASDQQGNYVPTTPLHIIRDQQFMGSSACFFPGTVSRADCRPVDLDSARHQRFRRRTGLVDAGQMGPLNGGLLHLGYYRPELFRVLLHERASRPQAAVVSLTRDFEFAPSMAR
jgi:hypothetical protein